MNCEPDADCAPAVGGDPVAAGYAFGRLCSWAVQEALVHGGRVGLIASFAPTLVSMPREFPAQVELRCALAAGAMEALNAGDRLRHDALVVDAARKLAAAGCSIIALAQFSMARAAPAVRQALGLPVLTTPESAVRALRQRLAT